MICCQYSSSERPASLAIAGVPYRPSVQVKRPSFSFAVRQSSSGFIAFALRMILRGSACSSAYMSASLSTATWWSISSTSPRAWRSGKKSSWASLASSR